MAGFLASFFLMNMIPTPIKPDVERRYVACYNSARKEWKCKAVRDRYEGKEFEHLENLKEYVTGNIGVIDSELQNSYQDECRRCKIIPFVPSI